MSVTRRTAIAATVAAPAALLAQPRQPNIVYIMADDMGYADLSCYGRREYKTPNLDRFARQGVRLLSAYANSSVCTATRVGLITGRYQYRLPIGLEEPLAGGARRDVGLPPEHPTIASLLKKAGYQTALVGKWHMGLLPKYGPLQSGYEHFWGFRSGGVDYFSHRSNAADANSNDLWDGDTNIQQAGYLTDLLGDRAVSTIKTFAAARRPFLLSLHFNAPHWPWEGPMDEAESKRIRNLFHYDGGTMDTYAQMVTRLDFQVGRALAAIDSAGIANNTIVVFTSDNGGERFGDTWPFTGNKEQLLEGGLRVPAIWRWPGKVKPATTSEQACITMDWIPTFLQAAGAQADANYPLDGMDLLPLVNAARPTPRKLFWRFKFNRQRAMRDGDMKFLEIAGNQFLFNVVKDPMERGNLKTREPQTFERMKAEYAAWNATMLPEIPESTSGPFGYADEIANQPGVRRVPPPKPAQKQ